MTTKIYGDCDDLVEFEGDVYGEVTIYDAPAEKPALIFCSDGTLLEIHFANHGDSIWRIRALSSGSLLEEIEHCTDQDADPHSDIAHFANGLTWAYVAKDWEEAE